MKDFGQLKISGLESLPQIVDEERGSCHAVYEFLERDCGVRWYAPTDLGLVYDKRPTLTVQVKELRRMPAIAFRDPSAVENYAVEPFAMLNSPNRFESRLWQMRMKLGGKSTTANHGLYPYFDRFWEKNPKNPSVFEGKHPEYFAKGYKGQPPQMCYTNPGLIAQVVKDACTYFKTGRNPGIHARNDWVSVEPMDSGEFCKCDTCRAWFPSVEPAYKAPDDVFMSAKYSNYIFQFANAVQREVSKTCPDGHIAVLAYAGHAFPPAFPVDPKIYVGPCLSSREWLSPGDPKAFDAWIAEELKNPKSEVSAYKAWIEEKKKSGRLLSMWLYQGFPFDIGKWFGFHAFPGYHAHTLANQLRMFAADGVNGIYPDGDKDQLDTYVLLKYLDNPDQDINALLNEFFRRYYGAAGEPLKRIYTLIEETYADHANYPPAFLKRTNLFHQTEEIAWKYLGTEERMNKMAGWMEEARAAKLSDVERRRVALFDKGPWQHMVEGRKKYLAKRPSKP